MGRSADFGRQTRARIAVEAARIMAEEGVDDYYAAKRKAANRLDITSRQSLPTNQEVDQELRVYQSLFQGQKQPNALKRLRQFALKAMKMLEAFSPRLVGPVLEGTAGEHSTITLHVFANQPEDLQIFFLDRHIPAHTSSRNLRVSVNDRRDFITYEFVAEGVNIEVVAFPAQGFRHAPLSPINGKPMPRASREEVENLIEQS